MARARRPQSIDPLHTLATAVRPARTGLSRSVACEAQLTLPPGRVFSGLLKESWKSDVQPHEVLKKISLQGQLTDGPEHLSLRFLQAGLLSASFLRLTAAIKGATGVLQKLRLPVPQHIRTDTVLYCKGIEFLLALQNRNGQLGLVLWRVCSSCYGVVFFSLSCCILPCSRCFFELRSEITGALYSKYSQTGNSQHIIKLSLIS